MDVSLPLSASLPLSLKINRSFKKIKHRIFNEGRGKRWLVFMGERRDWTNGEGVSPFVVTSWGSFLLLGGG